MLPSLHYKKLIKALEKVGYKISRQKGSHIRMSAERKETITVPAHNPVAKGTLRKILRNVNLSVSDFLKLL